jgi:hypothetical protein
VTNVGSIATKVTVTSSWAGNLSSKFTDMLSAPGPFTLTNTSDNHLFGGGITWTELANADLTAVGSITYTVTCGEV